MLKKFFCLMLVVLSLGLFGCKDSEEGAMKSVKFGVLRSHILPIIAYEEGYFNQVFEGESVGVEILYYDSNNEIIEDLKSGFLNLCTIEDFSCIEALHKGLTAEIIGTYGTFQSRSQPIVTSINFSMDNPEIIKKVLTAMSMSASFIKGAPNVASDLLKNTSGAEIGADTVGKTNYNVTLTNVKCANLLNATAFAFSNGLIKESEDSNLKEPYDIYNYINTTYTDEAGLY